MKPTFHPAMFLGAVLLLCTAWLSARPPPVPLIPTLAATSPPRAARVEPASITLDTAILERYAGRYEGRGGFIVKLQFRNGKLFAQSTGAMPSIPFEMRPTSQTEFFLYSPGTPLGVDIEFDVARDGTVRGFAANTEYGVINVKRTP